MFSFSTRDFAIVAWLTAIGVLFCLIAARELGYWLYRRRSAGGMPVGEDGFTLTSVLGCW